MSLWIVSPAFDLACIISPALLSAGAVLLFSGWFSAHSAVSPAFWIALVLCVDVAHVYSTLFRTYFDPQEFQKRRTLYIFAPIAAWAGGALLYSAGGALLFWRVAAYIAVFHFIRQQYGFMMIYTSREGARSAVWIDRLAIYLATIYPLVFWHTHRRGFSWFVEHDFVAIPSPMLSALVGFGYTTVLAGYVAHEVVRKVRGERVSLGKNLFLAGTALSWYSGIVLLNGDLAFTLTNVISHGIPYIALVWIYQQRKLLEPARGFFRRLLQPSSLWLYVGLLILFSYVEEGLWDGFVWRERSEVFGMFQAMLPPVQGTFLAVLVPLLTVPQLTHYILDGFIWKVRKPDPTLRELVAPGTPSAG